MAGEQWIAQRMAAIEMSGIRRVFDLAKHLTNPVDLSIGQPHFPVPTPIKQAAIAAIEHDHNGYTQTQGIPALRNRLKADIEARLGQADRGLLVTSGTNGALLLALAATVNPGDEVILFDPYFVAYPHMVTLLGGTHVYIDTYPSFEIDLDRVRDAITPRTKVILFGSPGNPTGVVVPPEQLQQLAELARERNVLLISDEIYRLFHYDDPARSPAEFSDQVLVVEGFGKTYGFTGWRLGYAHGPKAIVDEMGKLQQFTFICAPSTAQHAALAALETPMDAVFDEYRHKRDRVYAALQEDYELNRSGGAFYLFPKTPWGTDEEFVSAAIQESLLIIPGSTFSQQHTHFRLSYAATDPTLERGIEILKRLARRRPVHSG